MKRIDMVETGIRARAVMGTALTLSVVLLSGGVLLATRPSDQMTTLSPTQSPAYHEAINNQQTPKHRAAPGTKFVQGSAQASERLMKELKSIYKSANFKEGLFTLELVNDNLYEWTVNLSFPDPTSVMHKELMKLKSQGKGEHVVLRISFGDNYPAEPPFVRVAYPALVGRFVRVGGSLCMQLLSQQFWRSDWSMEGVILSIAGHLVERKVRISSHLDEDLELYTDEKARETFEKAVQFHEQIGGW